MTHLDKELIQKLSKLSRIACSDTELDALLGSLQKILAYIELLNEVDTEHVTPLDYVLEEVSTVMRDDLVGPTLDRELFLANAPAHVAGRIRVPPVMKVNS